MDYDDEARKLFASLGLDTSGAGKCNIYNPMDAIYRDAGGGTLYVGNNTAAQNAADLKRHGVTHVVNCTDNLPLYHEGTFRYLRFNISFFPMYPNLAAFLDTLFEFVDEALAQGGSVLVHCLAGAHRAGTTGCLLLMRFMKMNRCAARHRHALAGPALTGARARRLSSRAQSSRRADGEEAPSRH
jgi:protein tyrosine phosphatase